MKKIFDEKRRHLHLTIKKILISLTFTKVIKFFKFLLINFNSKIDILHDFNH